MSSREQDSCVQNPDEIRVEEIKTLNDAFRKQPSNGQLLLTEGVLALGGVAVADVLLQVLRQWSRTSDIARSTSGIALTASVVSSARTAAGPQFQGSVLQAPDSPAAPGPEMFKIWHLEAVATEKLAASMPKVPCSLQSALKSTSCKLISML